MPRFPSSKDFDLISFDKCARCGSVNRLVVHHEVPIIFKWVPVYFYEVRPEGTEQELFNIESALKRKYFSKDNRSVICLKCQHQSFHTYTMCHHCEKHESPEAYNACARCFPKSEKESVRTNKLEERERTIQAISEV